MDVQKNNKFPNIIFWGPIGHLPNNIGGGESGNKRTIRLLKKLGLNYIIIPKPYPPENNIIKPVFYPILLIGSVGKFIFHILRRKPKIHLVHVSGFYRHLIYVEFLLLVISKLLGLKFVYEIRGGAMLTAYQTRSFVYRGIFDLLLKYSDLILSQGKDYLEFIRRKTTSETIYYPNYIDSKYLILNKQHTGFPSKEINLIYFGRLVEDKGVDIVIQICKVLKDEFNLACNLKLIGNGPVNFLDKINNLITELKLNDSVSVLSPLPFETLKDILLSMHFFLFPTNNPMEGHSNSLTEAMAFGVVPICTNHGFNRTVVDETGVILPQNALPEEYASTIKDIWDSGKWLSLSTKARERVFSYYTSDKVIPYIFNKFLELKGC